MGGGVEAWKLAGNPWLWSSREMMVRGTGMVMIDGVRFFLFLFFSPQTFLSVYYVPGKMSDGMK